ncbi:MAG TPA: thiolase family protein [Acidobacteriota bacterium]|nr:thiolase family protein [Acidobacteriota bacterium]
MSTEVVVTHGLRTVFAKAGTALRRISAVELGRQAVVELVARADIEPQRIDEVILGCAGNPIDAANIARVVGLRANLPRHTPAVTVQRNCGSGLEAITTAAERIRSGRAAVIVAGGVESMSGYPLLYSRAATRIFEDVFRARSPLARLAAMARFRPRHLRPEIALATGLTDPVCGLNMGETAEVLAKEFSIGREEQDEFALRSHQLAVAAEAEGRFDEERMSVYVPPRFDTTIDADVGPRANQSMEALAKLRPAFDRRHGTVTPGNSCMVTDGAAVTLVMEAGVAATLGYEPLGRIAGYGWGGLSPRRMGLGPCFAAPRALDDAGVSLDQIDLVELNEAFAAQVLACLLCFRSGAFARQELGRDKAVGDIPMDRLNVNGGAIALGHPVGTTGARLVVTMLLEMARRQVARGLATMCIGGGQGGAIVLER